MSNRYSALLKNALEKRKNLFDVTDAYRIVNGAADGFPGLTLDHFGDRFQVQFFGPEMLPRRNELVEAVVETFNPACVVVKERLSRSGKSLENAPMEVAFGTRESAVGTVREGNARFHVDLLDTVNPGLFLDMRHVRLEVEDRFRAMTELQMNPRVMTGLAHGGENEFLHNSFTPKNNFYPGFPK